jgi:hypothetical protein
MSTQEQPQEPAPAAAPEAPRPAVAADDNLSCQWDKCSERCTSAEALFVSKLANRPLTMITQLTLFKGAHLREACRTQKHK